MSTTANITVRMDKDLKKRAEAFFDELGMSMSTAFSVFVRQSLREGRIPFEISCEPRFNEATIQALDDVKHGRNIVGTYDTMEDFKAAMDA